jgi:2-polyprenyl-3-methyl-5-hydroxy-6-metoxy-1,4-benzoquinol methylase
MEHSYEIYYKSKVYDSRYPRCNKATLDYIADTLAATPPDTYILDIGAGNGRYTIPLLELHHIGYGQSSVAQRLALN